MTDSTGVEVSEPQQAGVAALAVLQAIADPVRWTVLRVLASGPACVCNLQEHVTVPGNLLSYHLKVLREAALVTTTRRGRWVDYALAPDARERMLASLPGALEDAAGGR
ncbi:ArsR/SmtB family transcription factor [Cellulomonas fimi]|uniref:Regulatory protein ArsR n=1 Tax=Cellulomonas fimi (strain ATCC 484 / DSM 20113 / JCM 1341 / CCUG 24087 / LMG 16345 / NBRC 15513 / NCIMB 8980 / NCTC 7547 / NRS-133) TaxID=590998 RepID=F4H871_CELFA|nr:metalloregulator ArsR/SmtB family transcription factor [Cellulomonas fimi]AEE44628.1 regulatory protein ArsR [Cellulomonas fimi ATCC 484]VEH26827.1 Arsenical resistance operon repressor [Cellulomonas fimi]